MQSLPVDKIKGNIYKATIPAKVSSHAAPGRRMTE